MGLARTPAARFNFIQTEGQMPLSLPSHPLRRTPSEQGGGGGHLPFVLFLAIQPGFWKPQREFAASSGRDTLHLMATTTSAPTKKRETLAEKSMRLTEQLSVTEADRDVLSEALSNAVAMLRQEDVGWAAPGENDLGFRGLDLKDIKKWSRQIRASLSGTGEKAPNPHMRNGLMLRHSFIWDGGIHYEGVPGDSENEVVRGRKNIQALIDDPSNQRLVFGKSARRRREGALYHDGLYLVIGDDKKKLRPYALSEITDTQRHELYEDDIVAYRITRREAERTIGTRGGKGRLTGQRVDKHYWVYVDWFDGEKPDYILRDGGTREPVLKDHTAFDLHANRPDGAPFGSPDAISALVWARIIRDLIMNGVKMQDALAMFAFKATSPTKAGQQQQALELARDHKSGSAAAMGGENTLEPMSSAGKGYDFQSIGFVVSTMAASLHVSGISLSANTALAGSSYGAAKTLDLPGRMAMETRRAEHIEFDERILAWLGAPKATAYFNSYDDATDEYRAVQAAMLMWSSGNLSPEAFRAELENIYGRKILGSIPSGVIIPNNQDAADKAAKKAAELTATTAAPDQGKSSGAGGSGHVGDIPAKTD